MRFLVVGGGMQGEVIARNLAGRKETERVVLADVRPPAGPKLPRKCARVCADALDPRDIAKLAKRIDAAVLAVPSAIARRALSNLIEAGVPTVDISFTPEPPLDLAARARRADVPVILDCGLAPGLSHILAGAIHRELGGLDSLTIHVGGIPQRPPAGFRHAIYFNARDLLDEYIRPARMVRRGKAIGPPPLELPVEHLHDPDAGELEAFPSDGLRTLVRSLRGVREMVEMTIRHPGHLDVMRSLRAAGLLEGDDSTDLLARSLQARFPGRRHPDQVILEVVGRRRGIERGYRLRALADRDGSAMARTTGYPAAAVACLLAAGAFRVPGVHPPEKLGLEGEVGESVIDDLSSHGLHLSKQHLLEPNG